MVVTIIGAQRKIGEYQGREYDNVTIRVAWDADGKTVDDGLEFGQRMAEYKCKSSILPLEKAFEYYEKGTLIEIYFDRYGNPCLFVPVKK